MARVTVADARVEIQNFDAIKREYSVNWLLAPTVRLTEAEFANVRAAGFLGHNEEEIEQGSSSKLSKSRYRYG